MALVNLNTAYHSHREYILLRSQSRFSVEINHNLTKCKIVQISIKPMHFKNAKNKVLHSLTFVDDEFDSTQKDPH